ncbi:CTP synthase [Candidatus Roizmanbacteria bacterium RIFCSPLOWO2_02_FULL_37_19]|uniref:CTP synthase n=1 Tax=Candidatus Roizmanbacteria bacterium RIFCSPHIGHO2_02_FULL_37_24 TaxID=1802037 RepID=A0A1F7GXU0_9BACT|nr:MAG: CTP synthase [Candidatus Roizmanbacteria bacterium RIFCSPHIGHO2_01_FULL_38_41]OGK23741.1 MAG: CTP synthase [Candidatus Roizmanbacteria bacterium RIFCSPHIGHO2_02_FULL_37_24]OGK32686.1 MAG: CTP synthase [Candidatus Roizmanbacteria bacterium RIFCSPHIGHO2_12_FULL_37_23]OGK44748.1 MAG: CTP synthase [Candidatus Roizmanbacteria bacterium RIFCSPLOWO2_01_FULL_37_57]OGK54000.1 MAG: CTP synthase [Candidatus Roizmanbacteria bacterium RIFCSPLOWO2_02_FULL_37_19]OGK60589.1 MAG: CTP synthase [Candidat
MPKYIFISGGVISGLGKGITSASIGLLLKSSGHKVVPIKCENYLNIDAGTINPIEHGDVFLCEDGTEADMDIGSYEKFLDQNMSRGNFITIGQIYKYVIDKERRFEYDGEDVEAIPHVTDEILRRIDKVIKDQGGEIGLIELGGTVGEYQNALYYEAARMLSFRKPGDVLHIHVSYVPNPQHLGEPKTKPAQLSVRTLNSLGIQPDILIARSHKPLDKRRKERLSLFCNLMEEDVMTSYDVSSVYEIPLILHKQNLAARILLKLNIKHIQPQLNEWNKFVEKVQVKKNKKIRIAIVGKYFATGEYQLRDSYAALFDAIDHASWAHNIESEVDWIDAEKVEKEGIEKFIQKVDGIIVPIGWGERGAEGMIQAASYAREHKIPYLGLCYGMQLAAISFARDVLGLHKANTEENDPNTPDPIIHIIPAQKEIIERRAYGGTMRLGAWEAIIKQGSFADEIYSSHDGYIKPEKFLISERHRHRYEFNDEYTQPFEKEGMHISARSKVEGLAEIIELTKDKHPFYIGIQGHPEYKSRPLKPHPLFLEFITACVKSM